MKIKFNFWLVVAIVSFMIGIAVRFYYGLSTDLWGDEAISYFLAKRTNWFDLLYSTGEYWDLVHPPLYYLYLKIVLFLGNQDWLLRLASLIWFFPSVFLVFLIGKQIGGKKVGLLAISLFSLHPLINNLAFQVRPYAMVIFFILLALYLFSKIISHEFENKEWLLGLILAAAFCTDYAAVWPIAGILFFGFITLLKKQYVLTIKIAKLLFYFAAFASYQLIFLVKLLLSYEGKAIIGGRANENSFSWFIEQLNSLTGSNILIVTALSIFIIILHYLKSRKIKASFNQFILLALFCAFTFSAFYSFFFQPIFLARNLLIVSLVIILILAQLQINLRSSLLIILFLFIYGKQSIQSMGFLYVVGMDNFIESIKSEKVTLVSFIEFQNHLDYYLEENNKSFSVVRYDNGQEIENLTHKSNQRIIFVYDRYLPAQLTALSEVVKPGICKNNFCEEHIF